MRTIVLVAISILVVWSMLRGAEVETPAEDESPGRDVGVG